MPASRPDAERMALVREMGDVLRDLTVESDRIAHRFARRHDLHATDFRALTLIHAAELKGEPLSPSALASLLSLSSGAASYLVERLVGSGHVVRDGDPRDRRRVVLRYADHGQEVAAEFFAPLGLHLAQALADHDDDTLRTALVALAAMRDAMTTYES